MDKIAFGNLVMENEVQLYRIAKSILRNDEDCMDAAQEAVTRAFERLDTLRNDSYAKTWLIRILIHECCRLAKEKRKTVPMEEAWPDEVMQKQDYSSLYEALSVLEPEFRVVLVLHYLEGFQIQEIAGILRVPQGTVKSRLYRGREKMRRLLSEEDV